MNTLDPQVCVVVTASVLEEICHPIEGQLIKMAKKNYPHLGGIRVIDGLTEVNRSKGIDILIGGEGFV